MLSSSLRHPPQKPRRKTMPRKPLTRSAGAALGIVLIAALWGSAAGATPATAPAGSALDPNNFVAVVDNPYYPLPVGRTLAYSGIKDGRTQRDTVTVTNETKAIGGGTAADVRAQAAH